MTVPRLKNMEDAVAFAITVLEVRFSSYYRCEDGCYRVAEKKPFDFSVIFAALVQRVSELFERRTVH